MVEVAKLIEYVRTHPHASFVELEKLYGDDSDGDCAIFFNREAGSNIVLWLGVSQEFADAILSKEFRDATELNPAHLLVYMCDGKVPGLPIAKSLKTKYKKMHWIPVTFTLKRKVM